MSTCIVTQSFDSGPTYKDLRVNLPICQQYVDDMLSIGEKVLVEGDDSFTASTDMGNALSKLFYHSKKLTDNR